MIHKQNQSYFLIQEVFFSPRKYCHVNLPMSKIVIHLVHGSWKMFNFPNCNDILIYTASMGRVVGFHNSRIARNDYDIDMNNILLKCWIKKRNVLLG